MKKEFVNEKIGGDGGKAIVGAEDGLIKVELSFPILKMVEPAKTFVKGLIPGEKFDGYVDVLADGLLKMLGVEAPKAEVAAAPEVVI